MSILRIVNSTARACSYATRRFCAQAREVIKAWGDSIRSLRISSAIRFLNMNAFYNSLSLLLGLGAEPKDLTFIQISLRGVVVFIATLIMVRLGHKRSLSRKTAFDAVLLVILASVLSRAINGSAAFFADTRRRFGPGASASAFGLHCLSLALVRLPHQRSAGSNYRRWQFRF